MDERAPELLEGAGDPHIHTSPSLVPNRKSDIWRLVDACERWRMAFGVVKWHHGDSVTAVEVVNSVHHGPFRLYGGLVLNAPVGGLNPYAVDVAVTLGAKIVWLPTLDADGHGRAIGQLGGFPFQQVRRTRLPETGIRIVDEGGELKAEMKDILSILSGSETVLATGHITTEEIIRLEEFIRREGLDLHLLVNHIDFSVPNLTVKDVETLSAANVWFELAYFTVSALGHSSTEAIKHLVETNPTAQFVLATDSGQQKNPICPEAMLDFVSLLLDGGVSKARLDLMLHRNTRELLMIND